MNIKSMVIILSVILCAVIVLPTLISSTYYKSGTDIVNETLKMEITSETREETTAVENDKVEITTDKIIENPEETVSIYIDDDSTYNYISVSEYLYGVVLAEMPSSFDLEALKAQAIACRSYLYYRLGNDSVYNSEYHGSEGADVCSNHNHCTAYISYSSACASWGEEYTKGIYEKIKQAVDSTKGQVMTYNGKIINAVFHAISYKATESAEKVWGNDIDYLQSVSSPEDSSLEKSLSTAQFKSKDLKTMLFDYCNDTVYSKDKSAWIGVTEYAESGRVDHIVLCGIRFTGKEIRKIFGIKSTNFKLTYDEENDTFSFEVFGWGHGVGLSQYGANLLAEQGFDYRQILLHYYTGVKIEENYERS